MTAEIAVLNKSAIAVAADSAVTRGRNKVHVTANKIFRISDRQPIGLMVYGNAEVIGTPWELIAKLFRKSLNGRDFPTVAEAAEALMAFLVAPPIMDEKAAERELLAIAYDIAEDMRKKSAKPTARATSRALAENLDAFAASLNEADDLSGFDVMSKKTFKQKHDALCADVLTQVFDNVGLTKVASRRFPEVVRLSTGKSANTAYMSGLVVFGFGQTEVFPALHHNVIDCAPFGRLRVLDSGSTKISREPGQSVAILAFARAEMARLFMESIEPRTKAFFNSSVRMSLEEFGDKIFKEFRSIGKISDAEEHVYKEIFKREVKDFSEVFRKGTEEYLHENSVSGTLSALDGLGKDDMAKLAESLVEVSSLKLRVSRQVEVVGGPIDVAVLSKNDGFVWIKRKHYFDERFNPHYFRRFRDMERFGAGEKDED